MPSKNKYLENSTIEDEENGSVKMISSNSRISLEVISLITQYISVSLTIAIGITVVCILVISVTTHLRIDCSKC